MKKRFFKFIKKLVMYFIKRFILLQYKIVISYISCTDYWFNGMWEDYKWLFWSQFRKNNLKLKKDYAEKSLKQLVYKYKVNIDVKIINYQWKELMLKLFIIQLIPSSMKKIEFYSYISGDNKQDACYSHAPMINLFKI